MAQEDNQRRLRQGIALFGCLAFTAALASLVVYGLYSRYLADDYCYDVWFTGRNFWQAWISSYYLPTPFAGHRLSLTLFSGLGMLVGVPSAAWFTTLSVILFTAGTAWTIWGASRSFRLSLTWLEVILIAEALVSLTLFQAPNRYQILYWRTGLLCYLAPMVFQTFLYGLILYQATYRPGSRWLLVLAALIAFAAPGFSETSGAFQASVLGLSLLVALWRKKAGSPAAARFIPALTTALIATLLMMVVLFICPTNAARMQVKQVQTYNPIQILLMSGRFAYDFTRDTLKGLPVPTAFTAALFALLALTKAVRFPEVSLSKAGIGVALAFVIGFVLLMSMIAPSVVAQSSFPELRALLLGRFALVLAFAGMGVFMGLAALELIRRFGNRGFISVETGALILLAILTIYPVRMTVQANREIPAAQARATAWDARDQLLRLSKQQGKQEVVVKALDSIGRIFELQENPGHWVNSCAEDYYGIRSISAVEQ